MILNKIKHKIFLNAGHFDIEDTPHIEDPGASIQLEDALFIEALEVMAIRDLVLPLLEQQGFEVVKIPDYLNLADSIALVNEKTSNINDGLCLDLHLNWNGDRMIRGAEAYHYAGSSSSAEIARTLAERVSEALGIPDRGGRPDNQTAAGELGWLRKTTPWASLVEFGYITNEEDIIKLREPGGYEKCAQGLVRGVCELFGVEYKKTAPEGNSDDDSAFVVRVPKGATTIKIIRV